MSIDSAAKAASCGACGLPFLVSPYTEDDGLNTADVNHAVAGLYRYDYMAIPPMGVISKSLLLKNRGQGVVRAKLGHLAMHKIR